MKNASTVTLTVSRYVPFKDGRNFEGKGDRGFGGLVGVRSYYPHPEEQ